MDTIDTLYVLDYDRCLGDVDASFCLLKKIVHKLSIINEDSFQHARDTAESKGLSFSALEYIRNFDSSVDIKKVESLFIEYSAKNPSALLENGAIDLINYLDSSGRHYCIMSYGENKWQELKIRASGLSSIPNIIVHDSYKCRNILKWKDSNNQKFAIPKWCFYDKKTRYANEVVLVDDKLIAFTDISEGIRGYYVDNKSSRQTGINEIPKLVKKIEHINQVIYEESKK